MKALKTIGLSLIVIGGIYFLIRLLTSTPDYELNNVNQAYLHGDFNRAQRELNSAASSIPNYKYHLYQGYLDRNLNNIPSSDENFDKAMEEARIRQLPQLQLEVALNQTLNAYLQNNWDKFKQALSVAQGIDPKNTWVSFFEGLESYQKQDYNKAIDEWSINQDRPYLSAWMKYAFEDVFNADWTSINISKAQIETGNVSKARDSLLQQSRKANGKSLDEINFLIGYSFIKEGDKESPEALLTYIKLALPYFQKLPNGPKYDVEKQRFTDLIVKNIDSLSARKSIQDLTPIIKYLQSINATQALDQIKNDLVKLLNQDIESKDPTNVVSAATALELIGDDHEQKEMFSQKLLDVVNQMLANGNVKGISNFWQASKSLSPAPEQHEQEMVEILEKKILETIQSDDNNLTQSKPYISFWYQLGLSARDKEAFANRLLDQAQASWTTLNQPEKGFALVKIVYNLYAQENKEAINAKLIPLLDRALNQSIDQANIGNIENITLLAKDLNLSLPSQKTTTTSAKILAYAHDQYIKKNWVDAKKHADWVLSLDPQNEQALEISGLSDYQLANYPEAVKFLSKVARPSQEVLESLAVSQVLGGDKTIGMDWITKTQTSKPLSHDAYLRLGFGALIEKNPQISNDWFNHISDKSGELAVAEIYRQYLLGNYQETYDLIQKLKTPFSQLDGVQAIAVKSLIALDKTDKAESDLKALINMPPVTNLQTFSPPFLQFKELVLDKLSRDYIAGDFYLEVKKDAPRALQYFMKIKEPSPEVNYDMGMINISQMKFQNALPFLLKASLQNEDFKIKNLAVPLLAHLYLTLHREYDAYPWYQAFVKGNPDDIEARHVYASILMFINRNDLAVEQFQYLTSKNQLNIDEEINYVKALTHAGKFSDARDLASRLVKSNSLDNTHMMELGNTLIILNMVGSIEPKVSDIFAKRKDLNDPVELNALAKLLINLGAYSQVEELIKLHENIYNSNIEGLLILAEYNQRLSRTSEALGFAQQAYEQDQENQKVIIYLDQYETNIELLKSLLAGYKKTLNEDPSNITAAIHYAGTLFRLAEIFAAHPDKTTPDYSLELQNANFVLSKLVALNLGIPKIDFLQGVGQYYLGNYANAIKSFDKALKENPSSVEGNRFSALSAEKSGNAQLASGLMKTALSFSPYSAKLWEELSQISLKLGDVSDAIVSYQQMIKFAPYDISGYLALGKIYLNLKDPEAAKKVLENAVKIDPSNTQALSLLLRSLYDKSLSLSIIDNRELVRQQAEVYSKLLKIDPESAQKLMSELTGSGTTPETKSDK